MKLTRGFMIWTVVVTLVIIPVLFNFVFLWDSGLAKGEMSDWFTLYGNIFGGLIGGFFTFLAVQLTFEKEEANKENEMRPRIDIPNQSIEFTDEDENIFSPIVIELNNIGGSIAKNIECTLSLSNYEEVLNALNKEKEYLKINIQKSTTTNLTSEGNKVEEYHQLMIEGQESKYGGSLGSVHKEYKEDFVGTCIPLIWNHEAKTQYVFRNNVSNWINYIVRNRNYRYGKFNEKELFNFTLDIKYSSNEYGNFHDRFKLEWQYIGMEIGLSEKYHYVLKSTKEDNQ